MFGDTFDYYRCGMALALNTFGPHLLPVLLLPLVALRRSSSSKARQVSNRCAMLQVVPDATALFMTILGALLYHSAVACFTMCNAMIQRRHLMVWRVFAPKFIFDSALLVCADAVLLLFWPWLSWTSAALRRFIHEVLYMQDKHERMVLEK